MVFQGQGSEELQKEQRYPVTGSSPQKCPKKRVKLILRGQLKENSQERNFRSV